MFTEYFSTTPALAAEAERVAVYARDPAACELGFVTAVPVRAGVQSPWVYRIQAPFLRMHAGIEASHEGELYYAERVGSYPALRLDNPAQTRDVPQFLYATVSEFWAAQAKQEQLLAAKKEA